MNIFVLQCFRELWTPRKIQIKMGDIVRTGILLTLFFSQAITAQTTAQCFGPRAYEKTTGSTFSSGTTQSIYDNPGSAVTRDCAAFCRQTTTCEAFTVDYNTGQCTSYDRSSVERRENLRPKPGTNFFEKVCFSGVSNYNSLCGDRLWAFERVVGGELQGLNDKELNNIQSKAECERLCLTEVQFVCRSAEYDSSKQICFLSRDDRRTQPNAFRVIPGSAIDYLENQCVRALPDCRYETKQDLMVLSMDDLQFASSQGDCEALCDVTRLFSCWAYTYDDKQKRCYLSGDDTISLGNARLLSRPGAIYGERTCTISQCEQGIFTFEKVTGRVLRSARQEDFVISSMQGVTVECRKKCLESASECPGFVVDYNRGRCYKLDRNSQGRHTELVPLEGQSYFERVCLRGNIGSCRDKAWAFERTPMKEIRGYDDRRLMNVQTRRDCEEACLQERTFVCRSAEYDSQTAECRLSREDRRTKGEEYVDAGSTVDYLENQCVKVNPGCSYESTKNSYPRFLDNVMDGIPDERQCQRECDSFREFNCRSYSYYPTASQCFISGDDTASAGPSALESRGGTDYLERKCKTTTHRGPTGGSGNLSSNAEIDSSNSNTNISPNRPLRPTEDLEGTGMGSMEEQGITETVEEKNPAEPSESSENEIASYEGFITPCKYGKPHFEKVLGYGYMARGISLFNDRTPGIVDQCVKRCDTEGDCRSFVLDYNENECFMFTTAAAGNYDLKEDPGISYFESLCLRGPSCGMLWTFERMVDFMLEGHDKDVIRDVTKIECEDHCLEERRFVCRSISYDHRRRECRLSDQDRFSQPRSLVRAPDVSYLENQCAVRPEGNCRYGNRRQGGFFVYVVKSLSAFSEETCERACDVEREFNCRSYSFLPSVRDNQCLLSSEGGHDRSSFMRTPEAKYAEKLCNEGSNYPAEVGQSYQGGERPRVPSRPEGSGFRPGGGGARPGGGGVRAGGGGARPGGGGARPGGGDSRYKDRDNYGARPPPRGGRFPDGPVRPPFEGDRGRPNNRIPYNPNQRPSGYNGPRDTAYQKPGPRPRPEWEDRHKYNYIPGPTGPRRRPYEPPKIRDRPTFIEKPGTSPLPDAGLRPTSHNNLSPRPSRPSSISSPTSTPYTRPYDRPPNRREPPPELFIGDGRDPKINYRPGGGPYRPGSDRESDRPGRIHDRDHFHPRPDFEFEHDIDLRPFPGGGNHLDREFSSGASFGNRIGNRGGDYGQNRLGGGRRGASRPITGCRGTITYEKIFGADFRETRRDLIPTQEKQGITMSCLQECLTMGDSCHAVSLLYDRGFHEECFSLERSATETTGFLDNARGAIYFEKVCLEATTCGKAWTFDRILEYELIGYDKEVLQANTREECADACLKATFTCRSAEYLPRQQLCRLSAENRRTQPRDFERVGPSVEYLENMCAADPPNCEYVDYPERFLPFADKIQTGVSSEEDCRKACDAENEFSCRSFTFNRYKKDCAISSDDTSSTLGLNALIPDRDSFYSERGRCRSVAVECTPHDMVVSFSFTQPFEGRVYATGNPQGCFEIGNGRSQVILRISLGSQCGTVTEQRDLYVNHVVIQQHPNIMQDSDKTVRIECSFEASDKTVTYAPARDDRREGAGGLDVIPQLFQPTGTAVVANTAPTPAVRMRVSAQGGGEVTGVSLGEPLTLRIETDPTSAFGIFVRNLEARTENGEIQVLLDNSGCPPTPNIFPELERDRAGKDLFAHFKAFRFPSTPRVNFVATVQFCQDECEPARCYGGGYSFGRRRRRSVADQGQVNSTNEVNLTGSTVAHAKMGMLTKAMSESTSAKRGSESSTSAMLTTVTMKSTDANLTDQTLPTSVSSVFSIKEEVSTVSRETSPIMTPAPVKISSVSISATETDGDRLEEEEGTTLDWENGERFSYDTGSVDNIFDEEEEEEEEMSSKHKPMPEEIPVAMELIVGEDTFPENELNNGITRQRYNSMGHGYYGDYHEFSQVCSPTSTIVAVTITILLIQLGMTIGFIYFYRTKRSQWMKNASLVGGVDNIYTTTGSPVSPVIMSNPNIMMRSIYQGYQNPIMLRGQTHFTQESPEVAPYDSSFKSLDNS